MMTKQETQEPPVFTCKNPKCKGHNFYAWQNGAKFCKDCGRVQRPKHQNEAI